MTKAEKEQRLKNETSSATESDRISFQSTIYNTTGRETDLNTLIKHLRADPKKEEATAERPKKDKKSSSANDSGTETEKTATGLAVNLNSEQFQIWEIFDRYFEDLATAKAIGVERPIPPRIFVHGGPGTGKTYLINAIHHASSMERHGFCLSS